MEDVSDSLANLLSSPSKEIKCVESIVFSSFNPPPSYRRFAYVNNINIWVFFGNFSQIYHIVFALVRSRMTLELILITSGLSGIWFTWMWWHWKGIHTALLVTQEHFMLILAQGIGLTQNQVKMLRSRLLLLSWCKKLVPSLRQVSVMLSIKLIVIIDIFVISVLIIFLLK